MQNTDLYDILLEFLYNGKIPTDPAILQEGCRLIPETIYQRISELKLMQRRLMELQIANASAREAWGIQLGNFFKRKVLKKGAATDDIQELGGRIAGEQKQLQEAVDPVEMSDDCFQEYRPCGDQYIRVGPDVLRAMAQHFFESSPHTDTKSILQNFAATQEAFRDFPQDQRILGLIAILSNIDEFDIKEFLSWDKRLLQMLYGPKATQFNPMTFDRFLIHAVLYSLPTGTIEDRYIGFRIAWEVFRKEWGKHFDHQLRALVSTAHLLCSYEPFPTGELAFRDFFEQKLRRYRMLMRSIHHRSNAPDQQMGRGMKAGSSEAAFGPSSMGGSSTGSVFDNISSGGGTRIGIPDPIFVAAARLAGIPATISVIYQHLLEMILTFIKMNAPMQIASMLSDTPLYYMDRMDESDSYEMDEPGAFAAQLRERTKTANSLGTSLGLKAIHSSLIALQPGSVEASIKSLTEIFHQLPDIPESARRMVGLLLMDGIVPTTQSRRFAYEIWFAEGVG